MILGSIVYFWNAKEGALHNSFVLEFSFTHTSQCQMRFVGGGKTDSSLKKEVGRNFENLFALKII